jgi:tRNA threonylcarbamoyladenosine biosynthesis protein TsaB
LTEHHQVLVLDASSQSIQVGLVRASGPALWRSTPDEAGRGIFASVAGILTEASLSLHQVDAFIFCEGPGSMLGTRTVAMAVRTWQTLKARPAYAYQSLALAGAFEWHRHGPRAFTVIADARRDTWHCQSISADGRLLPLRRIPAAELPADERVTPDHFRAWSTPPHPTAVCAYDLEPMFSALTATDLFHLADAPDAFQHEAPEYKRWPAQIHSIATADKK